jgi:hypothetical protein
MLLCIVIVLASASSAVAVSEQLSLQWSRTYGPVIGYSLLQAPDGGYVIAGQEANDTHTNSGLQNFTPVVIKISFGGELEWRKTYSDVIPKAGSTSAMSVGLTIDSGYVISGGNWLLKTDYLGNLQWNRTFSELDTSVVAQANDGNFILAGWKHNETRNRDYSVLLKTDVEGNLLWNKPTAEE